jgi:hypothetical protein
MAIAAGGAGGARYGHTCVVRAGGDVACWDGFEGEGRMVPPTPSKVLGIAGATSVTVGQAHACALVGGGEVMCWGLGGRAPERVAGLVPAGPTGPAAPALTTMQISWDGSSCALETDLVNGPGSTRLVMDNETSVRVSGSLISIADGHTVDDVRTFLATYTLGAQLPAWLGLVAEVNPDAPYNQTDRVSIGREALVDLSAGTYGAFCFDPGLAGYVVADHQLVVNP